jgi:carbamoyltransferase
MDLAASVQKVCEEVMLLLAREAKRATGADYLCMAGGCALNCVGNGLISREKIFKGLFVQPAAGDAGGSLGSALMTWHQVLGNKRAPAPKDSQKGSLLGTSFSSEDVRRRLDALGAVYKTFTAADLPARAANLIQEGRVVGLFQGPMEFGPRALGARSIIGDARRPDMQSKMNLAVKFRESFRPFAPAVLEEKAADWFGLEQESPYMLLTGPVKESRRKPVAAGKSGLDLLRQDRSQIPAVTHVDWSARVQTLTEERNGLFYRIVKAFDGLTGCPVVINTSFNVRGEPIVNTPEEAYRCFMYTDMDALVLEDCVLLKEDQPPLAGAEAYKARYKAQDESHA